MPRKKDDGSQRFLATDDDTAVGKQRNAAGKKAVAAFNKQLKAVSSSSNKSTKKK